MSSIATITRVEGAVEVWNVELNGQTHVALTPGEALDAVMFISEKSSISICWKNVPQDFDPPGWADRLPRLPPSATA